MIALADLPGPLDQVMAGVARAHEGDADAIEDVVADDVTWVDGDEQLAGADEVLGHFLAHGGWRERFHVEDVASTGDGGWRVDWTLWLRADSTSYRRDGVADVTIVDGRITSWRSTASEREDGSLAAWAGD